MTNASDLAGEIFGALGEGSSSVGDGDLKAYVVRRGEQTGPDYNPTYAEDVAYECNAGIGSSTRGHKDRTLIQEGDKSILLSALSVKPTPADRLQVSGVIYEIADVMTQEFGGIPYMYEVLVRDGVPDATVYADPNELSAITVLAAAFSVQHRQSAHSTSVIGGVRTAVPIEPDEIVQTSAPSALSGHDFFVGGAFNPIGAASTDLYELTYEILVTPTIDGEVLTFDLDIGGAGSIPIKPTTIALTVEAGQSQEVGVPFDVYTGALFNANGGMLNVTSRANVALGQVNIKVDVDRLG